MSLTLFLILVLNGFQYGMLLFLIAAGLTLVFGVMGFINLAHGVQYMVGAYLVFAFYGLTGSFGVALILSLIATATSRPSKRNSMNRVLAQPLVRNPAKSSGSGLSMPPPG